jgi:predicted restriction endonuclease
MLINAHPKKMKYDLEGAIERSLDGNRTMWLENRQHGHAIREGDRMYLWSSGVQGEDCRMGRLIATATVVQHSQPHPQNDWQARFRKANDYDPNAMRINLFVDATVVPPVVRSDIFSAYPGANQTMFFRNGNQQTTSRVEFDLDEVLRILIQDRLERLQVDLGQEDGLSPDDLRRWAQREIAIRQGQARFRKTLLLTRDARCAVTGTTVAPCLQAAHIRHYRGQHTNTASNGILLRADVHVLFDRGLIRIDPATLRLSVHPSLKTTEYAEFDGAPIHDANRLDRECLKWRWEQGTPATTTRQPVPARPSEMR